MKILAVALGAALITNQTLAQDIPTILQEYVEDYGSVGASIGLIENGMIQFFSYGKMAVDGDEGVSEETIYEIGSITKVFTTLLLADMVKRGEVQLDDPIELYLPELKVPELDGKKITLRHLATHLSGIPRMPDNFNPINPADPYADYSIENLYEYLSHCKLQKAPGEQLEYSNTGMGLLGHILCLKSGKSYEQLVSDRVTKRLGMKSTFVSLPAELEEDFAKGHSLNQIVDHWTFQESTCGAGSLRSNVKDMTQFLAANLGILNSPITDRLRECHQHQFSITPTLGFGLGWVLSDPVIWHNGGTGGFRSYIGFNPQLQKGIVILTNSTEDWPDEMGNVVLNPEFQKPKVDRSLAKDPDYLNKFIGTYNVTVFGAPNLPPQTLEISLFGRQLASSMTCGEVGILYPESVGVFGIKGYPDGRVHFTFDEEGNVLKVEALLKSTGTVAWEAVPLISQ
jgi:D-alanyl-D-alanine-carboxypeptidase/D-alanyl-D-alanine-endopeptidase